MYIAHETVVSQFFDVDDVTDDVTRFRC